MTTTTRTTGQEVQIEPTVAAEVNAPALITIFDSRGTPLQVPQESADLLIAAHGFRRHKVNLQTAVQEFAVVFASTQRAIQEFVDGVQRDGVIDTSDTAAAITADRAIDELTTFWGAVKDEIHRSYPVRQGDPVQLIQRMAVFMLNGAPQRISLLDLALRRTITPDDAIYAEANITYVEQPVDVDPSQVAFYLAQPGFSQPSAE